MPTLRQTATTKHNDLKLSLIRASQALMEHGIYPIEALTIDNTLAVGIASDLVKLEEALAPYADTCNTLTTFVRLNSDRLINESIASKEVNANKINLSMINCVILSEGIGKFIYPAVSKIVAASKNAASETIECRYGADGVKLLEFCLWQSPAIKLLNESEDMKVVFRSIAEELSRLPISKLQSLAESVPDIDLFVSSELHRRLANSLVA
jgi:hypothetical protein